MENRLVAAGGRGRGRGRQGGSVGTEGLGGGTPEATESSVSPSGEMVAGGRYPWENPVEGTGLSVLFLHT